MINSILESCSKQQLSTCQLSVGAEFIRSHAEFGELFGEWRLYESARACYNMLSKKWNVLTNPSPTTLNGVDQGPFTKVMSEQWDFLHPRVNNSIILQSIQHVTNAVSTTLWDGVPDADMQMLIVERSKLCVPRFFR